MLCTDGRWQAHVHADVQLVLTSSRSVQAVLVTEALMPVAGGAEHVPRDGGAGGGRRAHGEADAEGRQRIPQVQGQAQQLAQGAALRLDEHLGFMGVKGSWALRLGVGRVAA